MTYENRVSAFKQGEDIQIRLVDGTTMDAEYVNATDSFVLVANEEGQFSISAANLVWVRKDLKEEENR